MKKLSTTHEGQREEYSADLEELYAEVVEVHSKFDDLVREYNEKVTAYNEKLTDVKTWAEGIVGEMQEFVDEKSEKWPDTDTGQSYEEWKSAWEEFETEELLVIDNPDDLDQTSTVADMLKQLPSEPE